MKNRRGQKMIKKDKEGQEEMVGFILIMIIVAVILVVLLSFSLNKSGKETVESYEVNSFIQSILQYTTDCSNDLEYLSVQKLIFNCYDSGKCLDERNSCSVLNSTLKDIVSKSWKVGADRPIKGYEITILTGGAELVAIKEGNITKNYEGSMQDFSRKGEEYEISLKIYY